MEYGNTLLGQLVVVGGVFGLLVIFATTVRLLWRRGKGVNQP